MKTLYQYGFQKPDFFGGRFYMGDGEIITTLPSGTPTTTTPTAQPASGGKGFWDVIESGIESALKIEAQKLQPPPKVVAPPPPPANNTLPIVLGIAGIGVIASIAYLASKKK